MASGPEPTLPISQADDIVWNDTKEIIALKEYTDRYISLYQGEIRNIGYELANRLIEQGIVAEHNETGSGGGSSSGSSSGGVFIVEVTDWQYIESEDDYIYTLSATWNEIYEAALAGKKVYLQEFYFDTPSPNLLALSYIYEVERNSKEYGIVFFNLNYVSNSKNSNNNFTAHLWNFN